MRLYLTFRSCICICIFSSFLISFSSSFFEILFSIKKKDVSRFSSLFYFMSMSIMYPIETANRLTQLINRLTGDRTRTTSMHQLDYPPALSHSSPLQTLDHTQSSRLRNQLPNRSSSRGRTGLPLLLRQLWHLRAIKRHLQ